MWQFAVCAVQFVFMLTHLCNILTASLSVCYTVCLCVDGWGDGSGMNDGKNELHLRGGGLWRTLHYTKCTAGVLFSYHLKLTTQYKQLPY